MAAALVIGVAAGAYQYITAPTTRLIEYRRIRDVGNLQPGMLIVVKVQEARK